VRVLSLFVTAKKGRGEMKGRIDLLSGLDFEFWKDQNPYFSDSDLNSSMKGALTLIQNRNFLRDFNPRTAADIVDAIETRTEAFDIESAD
jgi:hypothetical protein